MSQQKTTEKTIRKPKSIVRIVVLFVAMCIVAGGVAAASTAQASAAEATATPVAVVTVDAPVVETPVAQVEEVADESEAEVVEEAEQTVETEDEAVEEIEEPVVVRELDYGTACDTADCVAMLNTYGLAGLYHRGDGDTYVPEGKVAEVLAAYADLLGGPGEFAARVGGEGGLQYIVFDYSKSGNYAGKYFAIYCPAQRLESCTGGTKAGTLFLNMTHNSSELKTTIAHEFTHALDFKAELVSVETFNRVGGNDAITLKDRDYENHAEMIAQYLFPTGGAVPSPDTWDSLLHSYINECFIPNNFSCEIS